MAYTSLQFGVKTQDVLLPNGLIVATHCRENTLISYDEIFQDRVYEKFGVVVNEGDTIFDVGANIGLAVLWANERLRRGTIHAFEPIPATFATLEANVKVHNHLNTFLHNVGLADRIGEATFCWYPRTSTSSSMFPDESSSAREESNRFICADLRRRLGWPFAFVPQPLVSAWAERIRRWYQKSNHVTCRLATISAVIDSEGIKRIDLLKIDVEGAEFACLKGLEARHWPLVRQVIIEVHEGEAARDQMETILVEHGFETASYQQAPHIFSRHWLVYAVRPGA